MTTPKTIDGFTGDYRFLSNFYPCKVRYLGQEFPSVEHAFQSAKATNSADRERVRRCLTPKDAKRLGRVIKLREDWESVKIAHMEMFVAEKFNDPELRQWLLATGDAELIEGNSWGDVEWGMVKRDGYWRGNNHLGRILMRVRNLVQAEAENAK
jgi:ribA/ribD-fused uncharacterized protein